VDPARSGGRGDGWNRVLDGGVGLDAAYSAWQKARGDVYEEWMKKTDPANLQPKVRPSLRAAAELVRSFPPPEMSMEETHRLTETIEAPWGGRTEKQMLPQLVEVNLAQVDVVGFSRRRVLSRKRGPGYCYPHRRERSVIVKYHFAISHTKSQLSSQALVSL
jgi:hypothetical protein